MLVGGWNVRVNPTVLNFGNAPRVHIEIGRDPVQELTVPNAFFDDGNVSRVDGS